MLTQRLSQRRGKGRLPLPVSLARNQPWKVSGASSPLYCTDSHVIVFVKIPTVRRSPTPAASVALVAQTTSSGQPTKSDSPNTPHINILIHTVGHVFACVDQMEQSFTTCLDHIKALLQTANNSSVLNNPLDILGLWNM